MLENSGWYPPVIFVFREIIPAVTWYKTHIDKLLVIIEVVKTWYHYVKDCKHKVLISTDRNNLHHFMDKTNPSSRRVYWA